MIVNPKNTVSSTYPYDKIESVKAPDPQTVVTTFKEPFAPWQATLWKSILPKHVLQPVFDKDGTLDKAEWNRKPTVGAGPYVFKEWESGSFARFVAREDYWGGRAKIDELFFKFVPDDASQIAAMKAGEGDLGTFIAWSDVPSLQEAGLTVLVALTPVLTKVGSSTWGTKGIRLCKMCAFARRLPWPSIERRSTKNSSTG